MSILRVPSGSGVESRVPTPTVRPRRTRRSRALRRLVRETTIDAGDLVHPLFVTAGHGIVRPIDPLPGHAQRSVDRLDDEIDALAASEVGGVLLFGLPAAKDHVGSGAWDLGGPVARAIAHIRTRAPFMVVIADVCLCAYADHGHCGVLRDSCVDNDATLPLLARAAVAYADAGADVVAPSAMMDGQVAAIREALDVAGHQNVAILSYAAKYASALYGPFRAVAQSAPGFGDRRSYQMDAANAREALREVQLDVDEGADMVMVKPASVALDVIRAVRDRFDVPVVAYHVSGEYAMLKAAAERGWLDERAAALEVLTSIKRAGADVIISYYAREAADWLRGSAGDSL